MGPNFTLWSTFAFMPVAADGGFSFRRLSAGRASWNDCAPGGGNYLQFGGQILRSVFNSLRERWAWWACGSTAGGLFWRGPGGGWRRLGRFRGLIRKIPWRVAHPSSSHKRGCPILESFFDSRVGEHRSQKTGPGVEYFRHGETCPLPAVRLFPLSDFQLLSAVGVVGRRGGVPRLRARA